VFPQKKNRRCLRCGATVPDGAVVCPKCGGDPNSLDLSNVAVSQLLHPAGGINDLFVYEPIGNGAYVYKTVGGERGIATLEVEYEDPEKRRGAKYYLEIAGERHYFTKKPPKQWSFRLPNRAIVEAWIKNERPAKTLQELWTLADIYYRTFLDLPNPAEYVILNLFTVQTWVADLLDVVFYVGIWGEWGGGKTVTGEALTMLCRHSHQAGNLSASYIARAVEEEKLTLFVDELDSIAGSKDGDIYQIYRIGYRRGGVYGRVNPNTLQRELFDVFGPKIFTAHSTIEPALQTRTIPIHVRETGDVKYPIINVEKQNLGKILHDEWFLWWLENAFSLKQNSLEVLSVARVAQVAQFTSYDNINGDSLNVKERAEKLRSLLFEVKTRSLKVGQLGQLGQLNGRNVELAYQIFILSNVIDLDLDEAIMAVFTQKAVEEAEQREIGYMGVLKDVLAQIWKEKRGNPDYLTEDGYVKVSNQEVYARFNKVLKDAGGPGVSPHTFKGYMNEFGFSDVLNRKKMKVPIPGEEGMKTRLCNIFTDRVLRRLEIMEEEEEKNSTKYDATKKGQTGYNIDEAFKYFPPEHVLRSVLVSAGGEVGRLLLESRLNELGFTLESKDAPEKLAMLERDGKLILYKDTIALGRVWREVAS